MLSYFLDHIPAVIPPGAKPPSSRACFDRLVEASTEVLFRFRCTQPTGLEYSNPALEAVSGYPLSSFYSDPDLIFRIIHPQDRARVRADILRGPAGRPLQVRWQHADGSILQMEQVIFPVYDEAGKLQALEGTARTSIPALPVSQIQPAEVDYHQRLAEISQAMSGGVPPAELLGLIFRSLKELLQYTQCRVIIHSGQEDLAELLHQIAQQSPSLNLQIQISSQRAEVRTGILRLSSPSSPGPEEEMSLRLRLGAEVFGSVHVTRRASRPYLEKDLDLAHLLIFYACISAENSGLLKPAIPEKDTFTQLVPSAEDVNQPATLEDVAESIGRRVLDLTGLDAVSVMSVSPGGALKPLYSSGLSRAYLAHLSLDQPGMVESNPLETPQIHLVGDIQELPEDSLPRLLAGAEGFQSMAVCPLISRGSVVATVNCYGARPHPFSPEESEALSVFARQAGVVYTNTLLYTDLEDTYSQTVLTLSRVILARDTYTSRHSQRLADWAEQTARRLSCSEDEIRTIRWAALLHDIGKIGIPDSILCKAGPLTDEEWEIMRRHPVLGTEIIAPFKKLEGISPMIRWHQEKFDGSGYPDGLQGEQIPLGARILTVVDAFGAMTDDRLYRKALSQDDAIAELRRCSGTHFDSRVVQEFFEVINAGRMALAEGAGQ